MKQSFLNFPQGNELKNTINPLGGCLTAKLDMTQGFGGENAYREMPKFFLRASVLQQEESHKCSETRGKSYFVH